MSANILVIEDESLIQQLVAVSLQHAGHRVKCACSVEEAITILRGDVLPDVILLDWLLPGMSGVQYARRLRAEERTRNLPIIMLTARSQEEDKVAGLEAGADDYVTKPFSPRELIARIDSVVRRRKPQMSEQAVEVGGLRIDPVSNRISCDGLFLDLSPTEFRLLHFFMTHTDRIFSRSQLLDHVWGDHFFVEERTVDVHVRRLRFQLEAIGRDEMIRTVRGSGYFFATRT